MAFIGLRLGIAVVLLPLMAITGAHWLSNQALAKQTLALTTPATPPFSNDNQTGFLDRLVGEAMRRVGLTLKVIHLPAERALRNANAGIEDGDLNRIAGLERRYTNLIRVPEPNIEVEFVAFAKTELDLTIDGWHSLAPHGVGIIRGFKVLETHLKGVAELSLVKTQDQLFQLLLKHRVDVVILPRWMGLGYINQHRLTNIRPLEPALITLPTYLYLHRRHAQWVPKLAAALRDIKADGTYRRLVETTLLPFAALP